MCVCVCCVFVWAFRLVCLCGVGGLLFDVVWYVAVCACVVYVCVCNACALFVNVLSGVVRFDCLYYTMCVCLLFRVCAVCGAL